MTNMVNIKQYASELQTFLALKQIVSDVEAQDTCLHALVNSDSLKQTKVSCNINTNLKNLTTSIQSFGEMVVEHPVMFSPFVFTFCFRFRCILSTDIGGRSATIIWACLSFFLINVNLQYKYEPEELNHQHSKLWRSGC
jgi:hypothetical protein